MGIIPKNFQDALLISKKNPVPSGKSKILTISRNMSAGFLCVLRKKPGLEIGGFEAVGKNFPLRRRFEKDGALFWFAKSALFEDSYVLEGFSDQGKTEKDFPNAEIRIFSDAGRVSIRTDELGLQAIYVGTFPEMTVFSDSVKEIFDTARILWRNSDPDWEAISGFLHYGMTPVGKSFVRQVRGVPGGFELLYGFDASGNPCELSRKPAGRIDFLKTDDSEEKIGGAYLSAFSETVERIAASTEGKPLGVLFSGGLDSSVVLRAFLRSDKHSRGGLVPVSATNPAGEYVDEAFAQGVIRELWLDRKVVTIGEDDFPLLFETLSELSDPTESGGLGILLKKIFSEGNGSGITHFVSGSWTDAPIGASVHVMAALWNRFFGNGPRPGNVFETRNFSAPPVDPSRLEAFERLLETPADNGFFPLFEKSLSEVLTFLPIPGETAPSLIPDWICERYGNSGLSTHDLLTLCDLTTHSHRFSTVYSKMAASSGVSHVSPFSSASTRNLLYRARAAVKFNPSKHPVTSWDNQFFYKSALLPLIPQTLQGRTKQFGSFADKSLWLFSERFFPEIRKGIVTFLGQYGADAEFSEKILMSYDRLFELQTKKGNSRNHVSWAREQGLKTFLWRMLCASFVLRSFFPTETR